MSEESRWPTASATTSTPSPRRWPAAREGLSVQLEAFAATTVEYLRQERVLFLDGITVPQLRTALAGRPCVVVVRGYAYQADLELLRGYLADVDRC